MQFLKEKIHLKDLYKKILKADFILPSFLVLLVLYSFFMILFGQNSIFKFFDNLKKKEQLTAEINHIKQQNEKLQKDITKLKKDYFLIEKKAREELGLVKPDDEVFVFLGEEEKPKEEKTQRWIDKIKNIYREYYLK